VFDDMIAYLFSKKLFSRSKGVSASEPITPDVDGGRNWMEMEENSSCLGQERVGMQYAIYDRIRPVVCCTSVS